MRAFLRLVILLGLLSVRGDGAKPAQSRLQDLRGVWRADFNEDGSRVVVWLREGSRCGVWDVATGRPVVSPPATPKVAGYLLSEDRKKVALCGKDGTRVIDMKSGKPVSPVLEVQAKELGGLALVLSPDGETLVELTESEMVVLRVPTGKTVAKLPLVQIDDSDRAASAAFTKDGRECLIMDGNMVVTRYDTKSWKPIGQPMEHPAAELAYTFGFTVSPDGRWLATFDSPGENGPKGNLQLWDAEAGTPVGKPMEAMNGLTAQFMPKTNRVVITPARGEARVLDLPSLEMVRALRAHDDVEGPTVKPAADGKHLFVWGSNHTLDYCDPDQEPLAGNYSSSARLESVLPAPDGSTLYLAYDNSAFSQLKHYDHYVIKLSLPELKETGSLRMLETVGQASLSPDGRRLMVKQGWEDREQLIFYDTQTMKPLR